MSLLVIVPSRGRPQNAERLIQAWQDTHATADLMFAVDRDDPQLEKYLNLSHDVDIRVAERQRMCPTLNAAAVENAWRYDHIGFMGDDHLPRTENWDQQVTAALDRLGTGIAYGNDLIQGAALPTAVFMTTDIIRTLGWMCPPGLIHLYADNSWRVLGEAIGALTYLPDVIVEHLHPIAGKTEWDDGYREVNAGDVSEHDRAVYEAWVTNDLPTDAAKLRANV